MRLLLCLLLLPILGFVSSSAPTFRLEQNRYPRVRTAYANSWPRLLADLQRLKLQPERLELYLRAFKVGRRLEVWARNQGEGRFQLLRNYYIAGTSGTLGPKRRSGDGQVPEGFYFVDRFNPQSLYHLSLGLDYPNAADLAHTAPNPGGDIFIHGSDVTIGCLPITDALMEELYVLAVEARAAGQAELPVHIFPFELTEAALQTRRSSPHYAFWQSLAPAYRYFEATRTVPGVEVDARGGYHVRP
ncbi:L,D-transpeptidase family protein [Solirubrum puertoriconensis]|uniref:L,D-TPase catalytic domain-containing protein n=1 Tax=Solirubrum puertoriconensis TaxID=1751427 RepID=A0A9X0HJ15_SOLP1|nr:L,D-transpeptidase family protein [Solirubrum puertoriconensis]KUG06729.1 hypothetical protein ASU33_05175 [Solirubrum puertoriconensis]